MVVVEVLDFYWKGYGFPYMKFIHPLVYLSLNSQGDILWLGAPSKRVVLDLYFMYSRIAVKRKGCLPISS